MVMGSSLNDTFTAPAEGGVTINGGGGVDTLTGGAGGDVFVLSVGEGPDTVTDYTPAQADEDDRGIGYRYLK